MDVDVTVIMCVAKFRFHEEGFSKDFGTFSAELEHFAHGRVAVNVSVGAFNIGILGSVSDGDSLVDIHEVRLGFTGAVALLAISDVSLSGALEAGFHQNLLY